MPHYGRLGTGIKTKGYEISNGEEIGLKWKNQLIMQCITNYKDAYCIVYVQNPLVMRV